MAEFSKGKQHVRDHKPSRLRHVEQVPKSDSVVPETQLEAVESGLLEMLSEDANFLEHHQVKRSPHLPLPQIFGVGRTSSANIVVPAFSFGPSKLATNKIPPKEDMSALHPSSHTDIVVPSTEYDDSRVHKQAANLTRRASPTFSSPTIEEHAIIEASEKQKAPFFQDQLPKSSHTTIISVDIGSTESISGARPFVTDTIGQPTSNPSLKPASITKNTCNVRKAKKGKKPLISGRLVPWPPRPGPLPGSLNIPQIANSSTNPTSPGLKAEVSDTTSDVGDLAVKPQNGKVHIPIDGPSDTEVQSPFVTERTLRSDTFDNTPASSKHQVEDFVHTNLPAATQHSIFTGSAPQEPTNITGSSNISEDLSSHAASEGHIHFLETQQASDADAVIQEDPPLVCIHMAPHPRTDSTARRVLRAVSSDQPSDFNQQNSSNTLTTDLDQTRESSSRLQDAHTSLREPSSRGGPIRVTKTQNKVRPSQISPSRMSVAASNYQVPFKMTALETALDSIRTACLVDQSRMEDQMASAVNTLKQEKMQLESIILEQQAVIAELKVQQKTSKENLTRLTEKAKSIQRYVSGLQDDHEKCQKLAAVSQKQNKQVLQDLITDTVREKADLQGAFDQAVDSFKKDRSKMTEMINDTHAQYKAVTSRNANLEERLAELTSMYEVERVRGTELEKQLVPSLQNMQHQLSKSAITNDDKLSSMDATLARLVSDDRNECGIKDSLRILQKLESIPLLTAKDALKAESMLRFMNEGIIAGFKRLAKNFECELCSVESVRQCVRDQIQGLLAEISRRDQAMADGHLAPEVIELIKSELDNLKQSHQQLEKQIDPLRQSEATLKSYNEQIETERNKLEAALREHEAQARQSKLEMTQLQDQLNQTKDDEVRAKKADKQRERLCLEREREFGNNLSQAKAYIHGLEKQMQQTTTQLQAKEREYDALRKDFTSSKVNLESVQSGYDQLVIEVSRHKSTAEKLCQERDHLDKELGTTQALLYSTKERNRVLEADKEMLATTLREARTKLRQFIDAEASLNTKCSDLQQQLGDLHDAENASNERLHKLQQNVAIELKQTKNGHATQVEDLQSRLTISEDDRKDAHAKLRRLEAAHNKQLECHQQEVKTRFDVLGSESERNRKKLEAEHEKDLKCQQQKANAEIEELQRQIDEMQAKINSTILVPNSQPSSGHGANLNALQQHQPGKTRKKVDRKTNSLLVVPSSNRRLDTTERQSPSDRSSLPNSRHEGSEHQVGFFEEEYRNRFGPQVTLHEHEKSLLLMDPDAEIVPETQGVEFAQGSSAQFVVIESQVAVGDDSNQEENGSDLSVMPSEDLSEMLLDLRSDSGRQLNSTEYLLSPKNTVRTPERPEQGITSDAPSSASQDRPKSRANTASRMAPLPMHDVRRQRVQAHDDAQDLAYVRPDRSPRACSNNSSNLMHAKNTAPKCHHAQLSSGYAGTQAGGADAGQKRKFTGDTEQVAPSKKSRTSAQSLAQPASSKSKSYMPHTPAQTSITPHPDVNLSPSNATGRRSSNRSSSIIGSQSNSLRLSSTRNTRSKANQYADRFRQELGGS